MACPAEDVRGLFDLAALRREAASGLSGGDRHRLEEIRQHHDGRRRAVERDFAENRDERLAQARKRLIDEAAQKPRDLVPSWVARDRFDKTTIDRRAWYEVATAHQQELGRIDRDEVRAIDRLLDAADHRRQARDAVKRTFEQTSQVPSDPSYPNHDLKGRTMTTEELERESRITEARHGFTGKSLTDSQFAESWALAGIMERGIRASGNFHEKLTDYAHAFARNEKFDTVKGETIIRDIFKARYGQTMNQMREGLIKRESELKAVSHDQALVHARDIENLIAKGDTMPFYRAYDQSSARLAKSLGITQAGAKTMMKDAYRTVEGRELYDTGKLLEDKHHRPRVEAERAAREASQERPRQRSR